MFIQILAYILIVALFIRIILSWTGMNPENPIAVVVHEVTEPILAPIRSFMPRMGMFDLSPMLAMFILFALARVGAELAA
ncbi:MAG: YggT family protein [Dehalococcoidia bacterium]|jgi:YggT family protein